MVDLSHVSTAELLEEIGRRIDAPGPGRGRGQTRGHVRGQDPARVSADMSAPDTADTRPVTDRREHWRRSKAEYRARKRAEQSAMSADTVRAVVVVDLQEQQQQDLSADNSVRVSADQIPGLGHFGPTPEPPPPAPDDIARRRLRTGVAEILARAELERQRATKTITNPGGWLRAVAATIATDQADEISTAVETALTRWPNPTPTHVASLLATPAPTGRRTTPHVPVNLPAPQPPERSLEAIAAARAALKRAAS